MVDDEDGVIGSWFGTEVVRSDDVTWACSGFWFI